MGTLLTILFLAISACIAGTWEYLDTTNSPLASSSVQNLASGPDGSLYILAGGDHLLTFDGRIWVGTDRHGVAVYTPGNSAGAMLRGRTPPTPNSASRTAPTYSFDLVGRRTTYGTLLGGTVVEHGQLRVIVRSGRPR